LETQNGLLQPCPVASQVGVAEVHLRNVDGSEVGVVVPVYNVTPSRNEVAAFTFSMAGQPVHVSAHVRPGDYGLRVTISGISEIFPVSYTGFTLWGVPADPAHDAQRGQVCLVGGGFCIGGNQPAGIAVKPFLTIPTDCSKGPLTTTLSVTSYLDPSREHTASALSPAVTGCDKLSFNPSAKVQPTSTTPHGSSGLSVDIDVPQPDNPAGLGTPALKDAVVTLPEGMTVSPSGADGLQGCSDAQLGLGSDAEPTCPLDSKIGDVTITTPLLRDPVTGPVYLGTQTPSQLLRLFLVARGAGGLLLKIPGVADPDPATGQLKARFANNPQLPFSNLHLELKGGPRAPLVNPSTCGTKTSTAAFTPWSTADAQPVISTSTFDVAGDCDKGGRFTPSMDAGSVNPQAGASSPFVLQLTRPDGQAAIAGVTTVLPKGLLAEIKDVPLCPEAQAAAGSCSAASQVGSTTVGAGGGSNPLYLPQAGKSPTAVYLAGAYKDAPLSLSIVVPAQAGPFDLGTVVVRAGIYVDPETAQVTVRSDPLPTILKGIPLDIRDLRVKIDRPGFMINPTDCTTQTVGASISSADGLLGSPSVNAAGAGYATKAGPTASLSDRFQAANCARLGFKPKLSLALSGKGQTVDGKHPGLTAHLVANSSDANVKKAVVSLPLSLALEPENANGLCEPADAAANRCPAKSIVGMAKAVSVLHVPLQGPVYFVRGVRKNSKGQQIRTLPKLFIPLTGEGVHINLHADSSIDSKSRLVTTFHDLPDADLSTFDLAIAGGKHGILVVTHHQNVCKGAQVATVAFDGQNGGAATSNVTMKTPCKAATKVRVGKASVRGHTVRVAVSAPSAGTITARGANTHLGAVTRRVTQAGKVTLTLRPTKAAVKSLSRRGKLAVRVAVRFVPKGAKVARTAAAAPATMRR
jgi:hypothetical protein